MEYQHIKFLDNTSNQLSNFRAKNWIERNDESRGTYNTNSQIKFKTTMLKSSLCDYNDAHILVKETITVNNTAAADADSRGIMCKVCAICAKSMKLGTLTNYNLQIILSLRPNSNSPQGGLYSTWACCHGNQFFSTQIQNK